MKRIHFVTLSRSDYATLRPVAMAAARDPGIEAKVIAGGSHFLKRFGHTLREVECDGYPRLAQVPFLSDADTNEAQLAAAYARAVRGFVDILSLDPPDFLFLVGDRWEMLAPATAASLLRIPIAHHSGGDITQGSADNQTRYALSMLAHLHFTALPQHAERLRRMGEEPWRVIVSGEPALTGLASASARVPDLRNRLGLREGESFALATFHPASFESLPPAGQIEVFLEALAGIDSALLLTAPNPDAGSGLFYERIAAFAKEHARVRLVESLGELYYPAMAAAEFMIGNSSSGIWEAPSFGLPVVNLGSRQDERVRGANVVDAPLEKAAIARAIARVREPGFRAGLSGRENPYVRPDTLAIILAGLKQDRTREAWLAKSFVDLLGKPQP
jgi:UDP-hydrolysing UDP-N-acetyl-D-glucosamine 2-epimerase